jgi:hypothetical protein
MMERGEVSVGKTPARPSAPKLPSLGEEAVTGHELTQDPTIGDRPRKSIGDVSTSCVISQGQPTTRRKASSTITSNRAHTEDTRWQSTINSFFSPETDMAAQAVPRDEVDEVSPETTTRIQDLVKSRGEVTVNITGDDWQNLEDERPHQG